MIPVFDLHCDTPHNIHTKKFNHIYPDKLRGQHYLGAVFAHFVYPKTAYPFVDTIKLISSTLKYINNRRDMKVIHSYKALDKNKVNIVLGVEGGHIFDGTFKQIEALYDLGVRVFTLTWNNSNKLAHSAIENDKKGLTRIGREYLKKLRNFDVIIDLSHASTKTVLNVCEISNNQVIASHSCVRALNISFLRNISDRAIKAINDNGGIVGINFSKHHLGKHKIVDHIDYIVDKFGIACAAIGSDFDGVTDAVITNPKGLTTLERQLLRKGYKSSTIKKIFSRNFLRLLKQIVVHKK